MVFKREVAKLYQEVDRMAGSNADEKNCGRGLKLVKGTPARWCEQHGFGCWHRYNPVEWAQVELALRELERRKASGPAQWDDTLEELLHAEPPPELIQAARQALLAQGYELEEA